MTRAGVWRALAPSEGVHADKEAYIGYTVHATGRLDLDALATAYEAVCRAHPHLAGRIEVGADAYHVVESGALPSIQVHDGPVDRPLTGVRLDQSAALSALNVVRDGDDTSVCLLTHHGIADAHHSIDMLATLWSCYTDAVHGVASNPPPVPFPKPLEELLAERGIVANGPVAPRLPAPPPPGDTAPARHVVQHRLTAAQTKALTELGHREQVTINGLLSGVLLLVEAEVRDRPVTELVYRYTVNLRNHLSPPVGATEGTNVLGGAGYVPSADAATDAVSLGRAVGAGLRAGLADGSIQRSLLDLLSRPAPDARPWDPTTAPAVLSMINWGLVPTLRTPGDLLLTNFHSASRIQEFSPLGGYVVNTFDGRIGVDLAWPDGAPDVQRRLDCLREQLNRLTNA